MAVFRSVQIEVQGNGLPTGWFWVDSQKYLVASGTSAGPSSQPFVLSNGVSLSALNQVCYQSPSTANLNPPAGIGSSGSLTKLTFNGFTDSVSSIGSVGNLIIVDNSTGARTNLGAL